jgi:predicted small secreted protein
MVDGPAARPLEKSMNTILRRTTLLLFTTALAFGLGACNTMHGVGKDTQAAGEKIQQEADQHIDNDESPRP